jgi:CRP-like cAMP-binding protein
MPKTPLPFPNHSACQTLSGMTLSHLPRDGSLGRLRSFAKGAHIWRPKDRADRIYFLERGQVAETTADARGHEVILKLIEVGEPFGELCFCAQESGVRHTTGRAVAPSSAIEIRQSDFFEFLRQHPGILAAFVFTFCSRLSDAERRIEVLTHRNAEDRLGRLLLQLAVTPGTKGGQVELRVSHEQLAQMAAMSRSHVTVTMGKFRRRKFVLYQRNGPIVVDTGALRSYLSESL